MELWRFRDYLEAFAYLSRRRRGVHEDMPVRSVFRTLCVVAGCSILLPLQLKLLEEIVPPAGCGCAALGAAMIMFLFSKSGGSTLGWMLLRRIYEVAASAWIGGQIFIIVWLLAYPPVCEP